MDAAEAWDMLQRLRDRWHTVYTGLALICTLNGEQLTDFAATEVRMRDYSEEEIAAYIATCDPFDKAGAYAIQHAGFHPVSEIRGSYANVVGLPLCHLVRCLRRWRIEPRADVWEVCQAHTGHACCAHRTILTGHHHGSRI
jgi:predicted house-cleaning NTP pyrophosphatase (Maf/HAM1 superfamily)